MPGPNDVRLEIKLSLRGQREIFVDEDVSMKLSKALSLAARGAVAQTIESSVQFQDRSASWDLAIIQAAVYDAVQAIDRRFEPYHVEIPGASGSPEAAAAKAAHDVLVQIVPAQGATLDTTYHEYLANHGFAQDDPGVAVGQAAAAAILALRANDGRVPNPLPPPFIGGTARVSGVRRPLSKPGHRRPSHPWRRRGWARFPPSP